MTVLSKEQSALGPADCQAGMRRDEIAGCSEVAYKSLEVSEAKRLLLLGSDNELADYALEVRTLLEYLCLLPIITLSLLQAPPKSISTPC